MQEGYLEKQNEPGGWKDRFFYYYIKSGEFRLWAVSNAIIRCQMDFRLYPFDAQDCLFAMSAQTDQRSMERISLGPTAECPARCMYLCVALGCTSMLISVSCLMYFLIPGLEVCHQAQ